MTHWIAAGWNAPSWIRAGTTTRTGGVSRPPYDSFNLARHVNDDPAAVAENRHRLQRLCDLPSEPLWLRQSHGNRVIEADNSRRDSSADASYSTRTDTVCAVLTADCVPLLICDRAGSVIAAVHVGWRGLCAGIIENALSCLKQHADGLMAWLGPHICGNHYEVGDDVHCAALQRYPSAGGAFRENTCGRWQFSMETLITRVLAEHDIETTASGYCTYEESGQCYSHRRDGETGRMASLIWMDKTFI